MKAFVVLTSTLILTLAGLPAHSQTRIALKSGETQELQLVYQVLNCRSIMQGLPQVDVIEGPAEVSLSVKEGMVVPRRQNCSDTVKGGTLLLTVGKVVKPKDAKLVYRLKYKTSDGDRQTADVYLISLYP